MSTTAECKKPCVYLDKNGVCNYYLETGKRRPCECGAGCTVRVAEIKKRTINQICYSDRPTKSRKYHVTWDTQKGLEMWIANYRTEEIAAEVGIAQSTLNKYAARNDWPKRKVVRKKPEARL